MKLTQLYCIDWGVVRQYSGVFTTEVFWKPGHGRAGLLAAKPAPKNYKLNDLS